MGRRKVEWRKLDSAFPGFYSPNLSGLGRWNGCQVTRFLETVLWFWTSQFIIKVKYQQLPPTPAETRLDFYHKPDPWSSSQQITQAHLIHFINFIMIGPCNLWNWVFGFHLFSSDFYCAPACNTEKAEMLCGSEVKGYGRPLWEEYLAETWRMSRR